MKHFAQIKESTLAAQCSDYEEFNLHDWLDGDDRTVTVYYGISAADHGDDMPSVVVNGAATSADHGFAEVLDRAGFAALIGEEYVAKIEAARAEEVR